MQELKKQGTSFGQRKKHTIEGREEEMLELLYSVIKYFICTPNQQKINLNKIYVVFNVELSVSYFYLIKDFLLWLRWSAKDR